MKAPALSPRAVDAVGVGGQGEHTRRDLEAKRQAQQILGVPAAASPAADGDRGLAARQQHGGRLAGTAPVHAGRWRARRGAVRPRGPRLRWLSPSTIGSQASARAAAAAAARAPPRWPDTTALARARRGSPGLGVSPGAPGPPAAPARRCAATPAGQRHARGVRRSRAPGRTSSGSATVGPEAITDGSSPGTSEMSSVTTAAGQAASARRPPLIDRHVLADAVDGGDRRSAAQQRR